MPKNITQYNLLISCPGDIQTEIEQINRAVDDFNERYSDVLGISIRPKHWRKSSYAQSGDKPQNLLNKQFVEDCDAAVALLWTRFGTPTDKYGSGTEEEIEIMLEAGKQVFMYFSDKPLPPSEQDPDEYNRVKEFRKKYKERGMYFKYSSDEEFYRLFSAHLTKFFLSLEAVSEITTNRVSKLKLCGIGFDGELYDTIPIQRFVLNTSHNMENLRSRIQELFQQISELHPDDQTATKADDRSTTLIPTDSLLSSKEKVWNALHTAIEIKEDRKKFISEIAEAFAFELPEDFFSLGNLSEDKFSSNPLLGVRNIIGTESEKKKYRLLNDLYDTIIKAADWGPVESAFDNFDCIKLALENCGTAIDEDVEVTLRIGKDVLLTLSDFPTLDNASKGYLLNDCKMDVLFGIMDTAKFKGYDASVRHPLANSYHPSSLDMFAHDYSNDYEDELENIFCYTTYLENNQYAVKLKFDYIKHHTVVAFPTPIFLKRIPDKIEFEITSRNSPDVIRGKLTVENKAINIE